MSVWQRIKYFFTFTIPEQWDRFKDWLINGNLMYRLMLFLAILSLPFVIIKTKMAYDQQVALHNREEIKVAKQAKKKITVKETPEEKKIVSQGPKKYLRDVMMMNQHQVVEAFNNSAKYHGRYNEVVQNASALGDIKSFRDYLNPIIEEVQQGQSYQSTKIKHDFTITTDPNSIKPSDYNNGVMIIAWNSKAPTAKATAKQIDNIVNNAKDYSCYVFDTSTPTNNFQAPLVQFLNNGDTERPGFDSSNDWAGQIYGFKNQLFVYHNKSLNNVPQTMPTRSLANNKIKNEVPDLE